MQIVFLTALGVGGATVFGSAIGLLFRRLSACLGDLVLSFAAGVMLAASVTGLILPSIDYSNGLIATVGILLGACSLHFLDGLMPHMQTLAGIRGQSHPGLNRVLLFVTAIAIHNLPEGIAAGVSFGTDSMSRALIIAGSIALQNVPEGMVIIGPMLSAGISPGRTFLLGLCTGLVEVVGTFIGYFAVTASTAILPLALSFAGGTMLFVIGEEMIPETHQEGNPMPTYSLLAGFCFVLLFSSLLP